MDEYIPTADAAKLAKMSPEYIRRLTRESKVESRKFGHITMVSRPSLLAYLKTDRSQKAVARRRKKAGDTPK